MNTTCKRSVATLAICAALAGVSLPAQAETGVRIRFRDLDVGSSEGVAALYERIERAARLLCRDSLAPWDAGRVGTFQRCHAMAVEDAVVAINQPRLTALHLAKSGKAVQVGEASE
jgi:UrcA family protein